MGRVLAYKVKMKKMDGRDSGGPEFSDSGRSSRNSAAANPSIIKFDLSEEKWTKNPEQFWKEFEHTGQILVPKDFEKWLIGQERMKEIFFMKLERWVRKLKAIEEMRASGKGDDKDVMRRFLREMPGPYLLYVGEPGAGKSLLIKIANQKLKQLYKENGIVLNDVVLIANPNNPKRPKVRYPPAGVGKDVVRYAENYNKKSEAKSSIIRSFLGFIMLIGVLLIMTAIVLMVYINYTFDPDVAWFNLNGVWIQWMLIGMFLLVFPMFVLILTGRGGLGGDGGMFAFMRPVKSETPALIVDNSGDPDLFVDFTSSDVGSATGNIEHEPWGRAGLATHHRMVAGTFHIADKKILYSDEILNNLQNEALVTTMLTVLEDGSCVLRGKTWFGSAGNASLVGETDTPIDSQFFWIAAGNYNALSVLEQRYPMLYDRFFYGGISRADDEMEMNALNEMKVAQFVADECSRFRLPHICKEGVKVITSHMRRRASSAMKGKIQMRSYIQDITTAAELLWRGMGRDCACGVKAENFIHANHLLACINDYSKPIRMQILDAEIEKKRPYTLVTLTGSRVGVVNGLVVIGEAGSGTGDVVEVTAWLRKLKVPGSGTEEKNFVVTGAPVESMDTWMANSRRTVRTTIYRMYGIDLFADYYTHISFLQTDPKGIDGPSAGITMTLAIMSILGDPRVEEQRRTPVPMRLDYPVTGTVENLGTDGLPDRTDPDVKVGPIGGVFEKTYGAMKHGAIGVIIPDENYEAAWFDNVVYSKLEVKHAGSVLKYFDMLRDDK